ncbi:MAG TPA: hypothetical protein PK095_15630, partial [Myxococcota bacterium]|nr:hypothetical protein [Myxococcota bacterium]
MLPDSDLPVLEGFSPYKAVVIAETQASEEWKAKVSRWLVDTGCRYMMAWGHDCSTWDDSVDVACLEKHDFGDISEEDFVMTTWHDNESLEEVFLFAKTNTFYMDSPIKNLLFLHIGH